MVAVSRRSCSIVWRRVVCGAGWQSYNGRAIHVLFWGILHGAMWWVGWWGDFVVSRHLRVFCRCSWTAEVCFPSGAAGGHAGTSTGAGTGTEDGIRAGEGVGRVKAQGMGCAVGLPSGDAYSGFRRPGTRQARAGGCEIVSAARHTGGCAAECPGVPCVLCEAALWAGRGQRRGQWRQWRRCRRVCGLVMARPGTAPAHRRRRPGDHQAPGELTTPPD